MSGLSGAEKIDPNAGLLRSLEMHDGSRQDAREVLPQLSKERKSQTEQLKDLTELRFGRSNLLRALEELARQRPQDRNISRLGLSPEEIHLLLQSDIGVDSTISRLEVENKDGERIGKKKKSISPSIRAVASYLTDGMPIFNTGTNVKVVLEGTKTHRDESLNSPENVTIAVSEAVFKEYLRLVNLGKQNQNNNNTSANDITSLDITISRDLDPELLRSILKDRFKISDDESIPILKGGHNKNPGLFYWHNGQLKFDAKIVEEKPESKTSRKARGLFLTNAFRKERNSGGSIASKIADVTLTDVREVSGRSIFERAGDYVREGVKTFTNRVRKPIEEIGEDTRQVAAETTAYSNAMWGYDQNRAAARGELKMASDEIVLAVLKHVYSEDFSEAVSNNQELLSGATLNSVIVLQTVEKILATQELTRIAFEYTLGATDITEHKKQVSTKESEERKAKVKEMINKYRREYGVAENSSQEASVLLGNSYSRRATALESLVEACWEIAQVQNMINKESGDWKEVGIEIAGVVRQDAFDGTRVIQNIKNVFDAINSLKIPGLQSNEVMEMYYWNLGYKVVKGEKDGKNVYKLQPRQGKYIDRQGKERTYEVSSNKDLIKQCTGFYKDFEVDKTGRLQLARALAGQDLGLVGESHDPVRNDLSEVDLLEFVPQFLDKERIDRETPILATTSHLFSASSVLAYISFNAGIAMCAFDGLGRFRDTGEDVFAHEALDAMKKPSLFPTVKNILRANQLVSSPNTGLGWKRLLEVFQPHLGLMYGAQQFLDVKAGSMATSGNLTGRQLVPIDLIGTPGKVLGVDIFIPAELKFYAYNGKNELCIQVLNKDYAIRMNSIISAAKNAMTKIFGPLDEGFDGFDRLMARDNTDILSNGYMLLPAFLVHKAKLAEWFDEMIASAKGDTAVGASSVKDGKPVNRVANYYNIITDVAAIDTMYKALGKNAPALMVLVSLLPTLAEDTVFKDVASSLVAARANRTEILKAAGDVSKKLMDGPLAKGDMFIGTVYTTLLDFASRFPSLLGDGTSIRVGSDSEGRIDLGSGSRTAVSSSFRPSDPVTDVNRNLPLVGLLQYINWFGANFNRSFIVLEGERRNQVPLHPYEAMDAGDVHERLVSLRKALNELTLTFSLFRNKKRNEKEPWDAAKEEEALKKKNKDKEKVETKRDFGHEDSRFVRDFLNYSATEFLKEPSADSYTMFIEGKLHELSEAVYPLLNANQKAELNASLAGFFTDESEDAARDINGNPIRGSFHREVRFEAKPLGKVTGIETLDRHFERVMNNCLLSFQAIGIAERRGIIVDQRFLSEIGTDFIINSPTYVTAEQLEAKIEEITKKDPITGVARFQSNLPEKDVAESIIWANEVLAYNYGSILEIVSHTRAEIAHVQAESEPATRDILGHIAASVEAMAAGDTWGRYLFEIAPEQRERKNLDGLDTSTSPMVEALGRLAETDHSVQDAYRAVRENIGLSLLGQQFTDGYGMEFSSKSESIARLYRGNAFTPSDARTEILTNSGLIPVTVDEAASAEFRDRVLAKLSEDKEFAELKKVSERDVTKLDKNERTETVKARTKVEETLKIYMDFYTRLGSNLFQLMALTERVGLGASAETLEAMLTKASKFSFLFPGPMAILSGRLPPHKETIAVSGQYIAVDNDLNHVWEEVGMKILRKAGVTQGAATEKYGMGAKEMVVERSMQRLMLGTDGENRTFRAGGENDSVYANWTGENDPFYMLQKKNALKPDEGATNEAIKKIDPFGWVPLPGFMKRPLELINLAIQDFGTENVVGHGAVGISVGLRIASLFAGPAAVGVDALLLPIGGILGALAFSTIGSSITASINKAMANLDTKTRTESSSSRLVRFGRPIRPKDYIWSAIDMRRKMELKARQMRKSYDWDKGIVKGTSTPGWLKFGYKAFNSIFPQVPIIGPIIRAIDPVTPIGKIAKAVVTTGGIGLGFGLLMSGGTVFGIGYGIAWGVFEGIRGLANFDNHLALANADLALAEGKNGSIPAEEIYTLASTQIGITRGQHGA